MDLLTNGDRNEIRAALKDVADTFHKTTVTFKLATVSLDRWQEDRPKIGTTVAVPAFLTYGTRENDRFVADSTGDEDKATVQIMMNTDDLIALNIWDSTNHVAKINGASDEVTFSGRSYRIEAIVYDGYVDARPVLCYVYVDPKPRLS